MRRQFFCYLILATFLFATEGRAQQLPKSVAIGSNPPGSLFYALASGLAKVVSEASPMQAQVQPYAGTSTFVPLFDSGELEFGVVNAVDMGIVYQGQKLKVGGRNPFPHVPSSRLLMRGSPLRSSLIVEKIRRSKPSATSKANASRENTRRSSRFGTTSSAHSLTAVSRGAMSKSCPSPRLTKASTRSCRAAPT